MRERGRDKGDQEGEENWRNPSDSYVQCIVYKDRKIVKYNVHTCSIS